MTNVRLIVKTAKRLQQDTHPLHVLHGPSNRDIFSFAADVQHCQNNQRSTGMELRPPGFIPMSSSYTVEFFGWYREGHEEAEDRFSAGNCWN